MRPTLAIAAAVLAFAGAVATQTGSFVTSGQGCPDRANLTYEIFPTGTFDLDGMCIGALPNGTGGWVWLDARSFASFLPASGSRTDTQSGDDSVTGPWPLGFTFPHGGGRGSTTQVDLSSNGYLFLQAGAGSLNRCCNGSAAFAYFRNGTPSIAVYGQDLNPAAGGHLWWDQDIVNGVAVAYATWEAVPEYSHASSNTCQVQLWSDGSLFLCWNGVTSISHDVLVGYSGGAQPNVPGIDFSTAMPYASRPAEPLAITTSDYPTVGQTLTINAVNVPFSASAAAMLVGSPVAVDLDAIGMEGCDLLSTGHFSIPFTTIAPPTAALVLPISADPTGIGLVFELQAIMLAPGETTLGAITSNAATITVGSSLPLVTVETNGADSFNSDTSSGFFTVTNSAAHAHDITSITFDWTGSSNPLQASMTFDTGQPGMADRFDAGGSTLPGCAGTYRNGSASTTGLVYANTPTSSCDPVARLGWTTRGPIGGYVRDVTFRFTSFQPGDAFEVDIDTDGGAGVSGDAMDGMIVRVVLSNGTTLTGEVRAISPNVGRLLL